MKLVAQRVVQPGTAPKRTAGINAFCYQHGGRVWLDAPPEDLGRGELVGRIIEVDPPSGNRVRSYLEITAPDATPDMQIVASVQAGADFLADAGTPPPWRLVHGEVELVFDAEAALALQWQVELRMLLGHALGARHSAASGHGGAGILAGNVFEH